MITGSMEELRQSVKDRLTRHLDTAGVQEMENNIMKASEQLVANYGTTQHLENVYFCKAKEVLHVLDHQLSSPRLSMPFESMRELYPDIWKPYIEKDQLLRLKEENMATTDYYKCPKCKHRRSIVTQVQTRSADEPATTLVKCVVCNHTISF